MEVVCPIVRNGNHFIIRFFNNIFNRVIPSTFKNITDEYARFTLKIQFFLIFFNVWNHNIIQQDDTGIFICLLVLCLGNVKLFWGSWILLGFFSSYFHVSTLLAKNTCHGYTKGTSDLTVVRCSRYRNSRCTLFSQWVVAYKDEE